MHRQMMKSPGNWKIEEKKKIVKNQPNLLIHMGLHVLKSQLHNIWNSISVVVLARRFRHHKIIYEIGLPTEESVHIVIFSQIQGNNSSQDEFSGQFMHYFISYDVNLLRRLMKLPQINSRGLQTNIVIYVSYNRIITFYLLTRNLKAFRTSLFTF